MDDTRRRIGTPSAPAPSPVVCAACLLGAALVVFQLFHAGAAPGAAGLIAPFWNKAAHFVLYGAITALLWFGTAGRMPIAVVALVAAVGAFDELHQAALPGRDADGSAFLTGLCAAAVTAFALLLLFGMGTSGRDARTRL